MKVAQVRFEQEIQPHAVPVFLLIVWWSTR